MYRIDVSIRLHMYWMSPFSTKGVSGLAYFCKLYFVINKDPFLSCKQWNPGPEVIKLFSCSTQLSMKFSPLIHVKMPTIVGILTCMSGKNNILGLTER